MPGFKIADGFVSVTPDDDGFEAKLRAQIAGATEGLKAVVGLEVRPDMADTAETTLGEAIGAKLTDSISDTVRDELPPKLETPFRDSGTSSADIFTKAFGNETTKGFSDQSIFGGSLGASLGTGLGEEGKKSGEEFTTKFSESAKDAMVRSTIAAALAPDGEAGAPIVEQGKETGEKVGKELGASAAEGMSPLMVAAIGGAAALGAPVLLAGLGTAFVGIEALGLKSNKVIAADYTQLGKTASAALTQATAPLAGVMNQDIQTLDASLKGLQPQLDGLFQNVGPDITAVTGGVTNFASNALPGLTNAVNSSHADVQGLANGLGELGTGMGGFFTGLTRDASTTGAGLQATFGLVGNALTTVGTIAGSASSAISADLLAIVPAADAVLAGIDKLADPGTVGAAVGAFAAFKLGGPIASGLKSASSGMFDLAGKTEGATGLLGKVSGVALSGSTSLEKMANVAGGPWGIAIGGAIGLASGLAGAIFNAAHASDALTLSQQGLTDAVAKDQGTAGAATAAYVAQTAAADGLSKTVSAAGVSTTTWTQAVLGSKSAQDQVVDAVNKTNQAQQDQAKTAANASVATGKYSNDLKDARVSAADGAAANNTLTTSNQQVINSLNAQTKQVAAAIAAETTYEHTMDALTNTEQLFNASLTASYRSMVANAQASALATVGSLNLGNASYSLTSSLDKTVTAYNEAQSEGSAYGQVLTALSGSINSLLGTEAAFTTSLQGVTAAATANGHSLDVNKAKGAANITTFTGIANSADKAATAFYENKAATESSGQAWNDANAKLTTMKNAFEAAAEKAGYNKKQIVALANELFKIPKSTSTTVNVDTSQASLKLNSLLSQMDQVRSTGVSVASQETHRASGGPVVAGQAYVVGEQREEMFVAPTDGYIYPSVQAGQQAVAQHNAHVASAASPGLAGARGGIAPTIIFNGTQYPSIEQMAALQREFATVGAF